MIATDLISLTFQEKQPFERIEVSREQALEMFSDNNFKASFSCNFICASQISLN